MTMRVILILFACSAILKPELVQLNDNNMFSEGIFYKDDITHEIFSNKIVLKFNSPVIDISDGERHTDVDGISNQFPIIKNYFKSLNSTHGIVSIKKNILGASAVNLYKNHIRTGQPIPIPDLSQLFTIEFNTPVNITQIINEIKIFEEVDYAHETPSYIFLDSPNDEHYQNGNQWYLDAIHMPQAWDITHGDENIVVGVIDLGVDIQHPDLIGEIDLGDDVIIEEAGNNHGSIVAGIVGANTNNNIGIASVGRNIKMVSYGMTTGTGWDNNVSSIEEDIYDAINYCDILNFSWGTYRYITPEDLAWVSPDCPDPQLWINQNVRIPSHYEEIETVISIANSLGLICVAASGNESVNINGGNPELCDPMRIPYTMYPASYPNVIAVNGTMIDENSGSEVFNDVWNYGSFIDFSAPGKNIYSTSTNNSYNNLSGTSFSAPQVSGLIALFLSLNDQSEYWSIDIIKNIISSTASQIDPMNCPDMDFYNSDGWNHCLGYGRINAFLSLDILSNPPQQPSHVTIYGRPGDSPTIRWNNNSEPDIIGYNIYRKIEDDTENIGFITYPDREFSDLSFIIEAGGDNAYYSVTAFDVILNESTPSEEVGTKGNETTANRIYNQNETNDYAASHFFMIDSLATNTKVRINENNDIYTVYKKQFLNQEFPRGYAQKYTIQGDPYWEQPVGIFENEFFDFDFEVINENMYILWNDLITTFMSSHIYTTHISSDGNILIESLVEQDGDYAEIDILGTDTILTLWANNHSLGPSDAQFMSQIFDLDFQPLEEPNNITPNSVDPNMENYFGIGLCVNQSNATYMVCWKDTRNGGYDLYGHIFNLNGESLSGSFKINEYELGRISDSQWHFTIKEFGNGYIIPFVMDREDDDLDGIYLNEITLDDGSVNILPHFKQHLDLIYPASGEITMDIGSNGYSYVIWRQSIPNETTQLNGIIIDPNLNVIGNNWEISSIDTGYIFYPSISTNDDYLVCSWEEYVSQTDFIANIVVYSLDSLFANVGVENNFLPSTFLLNAYPNPFNSNIAIDLDIGKAGIVKVMIYNILGEQVAQITNTKLNQGKYNFIWNGKNDNGIPLPSGIYFIYSNIQDQTEIQKITLLK